MIHGKRINWYDITFSHPLAMQMKFPYLTQDGGDIEPEDERARRFGRNLPARCNFRPGNARCICATWEREMLTC